MLRYTTTATTALKPNGSLVVKLYYARSSCALTLVAGTGVASVSGGGTHYYGASVSMNATVQQGCTWDK